MGAAKMGVGFLDCWIGGSIFVACVFTMYWVTNAVTPSVFTLYRCTNRVRCPRWPKIFHLFSFSSFRVHRGRHRPSYIIARQTMSLARQGRRKWIVGFLDCWIGGVWIRRSYSRVFTYYWATNRVARRTGPKLLDFWIVGWPGLPGKDEKLAVWEWGSCSCVGRH